MSIKELNTYSNIQYKPEQKTAAVYFSNVFQKLVSWIDRSTDKMDSTDFDGTSMSPIWNGLDMVAEFKLQGIGKQFFSIVDKTNSNNFFNRLCHWFYIGPENFSEFRSHKDSLLSMEDQENGEASLELPELIPILIEDLNLILEFLYMVNIDLKF